MEKVLGSIPSFSMIAFSERNYFLPIHRKMEELAGEDRFASQGMSTAWGKHQRYSHHVIMVFDLSDNCNVAIMSAQIVGNYSSKGLPSPVSLHVQETLTTSTVSEPSIELSSTIMFSCCSIVL